MIRRSETWDADGLQELVADKGYHSTQTLLDLEARGIRAYVSEPDRGRRKWRDDIEGQLAVYANRRRIRGTRGQRLQRMRGEKVERSFAHMYETGGMRRTHLRGHQNILKRALLHGGAFNLGLLLRRCFGVGTPRGLQGRIAALLARLKSLILAFKAHYARPLDLRNDHFAPATAHRLASVAADKAAFTTGC